MRDKRINTAPGTAEFEYRHMKDCAVCQKMKPVTEIVERLFENYVSVVSWLPRDVGEIAVEPYITRNENGQLSGNLEVNSHDQDIMAGRYGGETPTIKLSTVGANKEYKALNLVSRNSREAIRIVDNHPEIAAHNVVTAVHTFYKTHCVRGRGPPDQRLSEKEALGRTNRYVAPFQTTPEIPRDGRFPYNEWANAFHNAKLADYP